MIKDAPAEESTDAQWEADGEDESTYAAPALCVGRVPDVAAAHAADWEPLVTNLHHNQAWLLTEVQRLGASLD